MTLSEFKTWFNPHLEAAIDKKLSVYKDVISDKTINQYLARIKPLALNGGKRGRPYGAWLMYKSAGGTKDADIVPVLVALELFHLFGLIHDDIIDNGTLRHGVPTLHTDISAQGTSQAILIGDILFNHVHELFLSCEHVNTRQAYQEFLKMADTVILGQMLDVDTTTRAHVDTSTVETKMNLKTASYTFISPLKIGLALAEKTPNLEYFCESFGRAVGIAYQIQDDLLDCKVTGTGKSSFRDIAEGQHTYITQYIFDHGTEEQKQQLAQALGKPVSDQAADTLKQLLTKTGALTHAQSKADALFADAHTILANAPITATYQPLWTELLSTLQHRNN